MQVDNTVHCMVYVRRVKKNLNFTFKSTVLDANFYANSCSIIRLILVLVLLVVPIVCSDARCKPTFRLRLARAFLRFVL